MEEKKKKYPSIPSNYVTLVQLQEKWIKEKQRKQIEKQQQRQKDLQQQQQQLKAEEQPFRRNNDRKSRRNNRNTVEKAVVAAAVFVVENESVEKEVISEESSKKKKGWKKRKKAKNQFRAEKEEEVREGEAHAAPENENVPVGRVWKKKGMRSEFRPTTNNVMVVGQSEGLQNDSVVEIEGKFGDLSMKTRSGGVKNDRFVRANGNYNRGVRRGDWGYRGGYERFGGYREMRRPRSGSGVMWVKKGEVIDANVDGNQISSSAVKELE